MKYKVVMERTIGYAMNKELGEELLEELRGVINNDFELKLLPWDGK